MNWLTSTLVERNQAGVINMKEKIINRLLEITGGLAVIALLIGIYISLEFSAKV